MATLTWDNGHKCFQKRAYTTGENRSQGRVHIPGGHKKAIEDDVASVQEEIPSTSSVQEEIPSTSSIQEEIPSSSSVQEEIPSTSSVQEESIDFFFDSGTPQVGAPYI